VAEGSVASEIAFADQNGGVRNLENPEPTEFLPMKTLSLLGPVLSGAGLIPAALLGAVLFFPQSAMAEPAPAKLTVTVTNIAEHKGSLMIGVYDKAGYATDKQVAGGAVAVSADTVTTTFDLPAGQYGIKMFHDVDGDGKMSTNPFGMPTEPFAFSNNAPAQFGPAKWDAAAFTVEAPATTQTIKLN
jgi:uncharacterized protein (DUF2141 family)